jgi:hypothetical protein
LDLLGNQEIPIGFSMALAKDTKAMNAFSSMSESQRHNVIEVAKNMKSKQEMEQYVSSTFTGNKTF